MPDVTIGFVPRDRFCKSPEALARILELTPLPFRLVVVDCEPPAVFRDPLAALLKERHGVEVVRAENGTTSNRARNLVLERVETEFVCLIENDCLVEPGWLEHLLQACDSYPADVAAPLLFEPKGHSLRVHFDDRLGFIRRVPGAKQVEILPRDTPLESDRTATCRRTDFVEMHCLLFRTSVFARIGPFDETQHGSRAEVDLSLALWHAKVSTVLVPESRVTFSAPPPVHPEERDFYLRYWDVDCAVADHKTIEDRWNLLECPSAVGFVKGRRRLVEEADPDVQLRRYAETLRAMEQAAQELDRCIPASDSLILVDEAQWVATEVAGNRVTMPFMERNGQYWGLPPDDGTAISELERLRCAGASFIAFGWPAFWWLEHYHGLDDHLRSRFPCVLRNDRLVVFDLRAR